jgi:hypothetical protein
MSDIKGFEIREEAGILAEGKLTDEQRQAGTQVFELIRKMVASPETPDKPSQSYLPRIDKARHNRVILIDGGRGSGKTALLLTLLECWRRQFNEPEAGKPSDIPERWIDRSQRIVPVGLLDLHPLPRSTNLLLHVVGRFERVVAWLEGDGKAENEPAAWHFTASGELESRKKWKKLLRAVAAGWDGSVEERSGRLDLEAYAVDLEEAEHQRLDVVSTFAAFIDALAVDFRKRQTLSQKTELPLFVLAVDDADMNPRRSVELLDVLRMLWHPRLAFVLTGHSELFRHTLAEHFFGELRHPLRGHMVIASEIAAIANQRPAMGLANEVYDKIIPTGHRCVLVPIPAKNRFFYEQAKLQAVFTKIKTEPGNSSGLTTLASHFENEPQLSEALPDRLRGLIDLADQASVDFKTAERVPYAPASRIVEAIWHQAVRGASKAVEGYDEAMVSVDETSGAVDIRIPPNPPRVHAPSVRFVAQSSAKEHPAVVSIFAVEQLEARFKDNSLLPRPLTAALMLAAGVASDQTGGKWDMTASEQSGYEGLFAYSVCHAAAARSALVSAWPLPPTFSLPFYAAFSARWKAKVRDLNKVQPEPWTAKSEEIDEMGRNFLFLVVYLWSESTTLQFEAKEETPGWASLAALVVGLMVGGAAPWKFWAEQRAGLLAAPEYGLSSSAANAWLNALRAHVDEEGWVRLSSGLQAERSARATASGVVKPGGLLAQIDALFPEHQWAEMIEGRASVAAQQEQVKSSSRLAPVPENEKSPLLDLKATLTAMDVRMPMSVSISGRLASMGDVKLQILANSIAAYKNVAGAAPQAFAELWQTAALLCGQAEVGEVVTVRDRALVVEPVMISYSTPDTKNPSASLEEAQEDRTRIETGRCSAHVWKMPPMALKLDGLVLSTEMTALYEYVWDFNLARAVKLPVEPIYPSWWPGVNIDFPKCPVSVYWPTPRWLVFSEVQRVALLWNKLVHRVKNRPGGMFQEQQWIDALAYSLVERSWDLMGGADQMEIQKLHPNASAKQWAEVVSRAIPLQATRSFVEDVMTEWLYGLYLLATPESGLSFGAAKAILGELEHGIQTTNGPNTTFRYEWFLGARAKTLKSDRSPILDLRRKRLTDAGLGREKADSTLRAIDEDAKSAGHPWIDRFPGV